jgi:hypothetical protein
MYICLRVFIFVISYTEFVKMVFKHVHNIEKLLIMMFNKQKTKETYIENNLERNPYKMQMLVT